MYWGLFIDPGLTSTPLPDFVIKRVSEEKISAFSIKTLHGAGETEGSPTSRPPPRPRRPPGPDPGRAVPCRAVPGRGGAKAGAGRAGRWRRCGAAPGPAWQCCCSGSGEPPAPWAAQVGRASGRGGACGRQPCPARRSRVPVRAALPPSGCRGVVEGRAGSPGARRVTPEAGSCGGGRGEPPRAEAVRRLRPAERGAGLGRGRGQGQGTRQTASGSEAEGTGEHR